MYFGTHVARIYLLGSLLGTNCAIGMSWLLRKSALEREGGLEAFKDALAEDYFIGKALWERSAHP